ncbi:MAG: thymidine phosphorylase [Deltaproteobacteria bacterium]|nr:thymidine phosphorylase [Deltaproteobacteria bacterium]
MTSPYDILTRKRSGSSLSDEDLAGLVAGVCDGTWSDAQVGAFLMAAVIRGLDGRETQTLTREMMLSGDCWQLRDEVPTVADKHSTGGVGDKVSLILGPLLAACDQPVAMLTGRGLGHTGGTADKLETIPGLRQDLSREWALELIEKTGLALGMATGEVAPADRRLYSLRDVTATVDSLPLMAASILSKKLATGTAAVTFDVKTGDGAFLPDMDEGRKLARLLVETSAGLGAKASAVITDMSQPLGRWVGHAAEVRETLDCLEGGGPADLMEVTYTLCQEVTSLLGRPLGRTDLESAIASGRAREKFQTWAIAQGAEAAWWVRPDLPLAPHEVILEAPSSGVLAAVANRRLGLLLGEAGGGRLRPGDTIDPGISLHSKARLGEAVEAGQELARIYLRKPDESLTQRFSSCFKIDETGQVPELIRERIS